MTYEAKLVANGTLHNITEELETMYDMVVSSMDWGSDLFDEDDRHAVVRIGVLCGFDVPECGATLLPEPGDYADDAIVNYALCKKPMLHVGKHSGEIRVTERLTDLILMNDQVIDPDDTDVELEPVVNALDGTIFYRPKGLTDGQWGTKRRYADSVFIAQEWD